MSDTEIPEHAENSPSSAEGWSTCADYINANRGLPDAQSWEAAEGTAAHWVRNECLTNGEDAVNYIGHTQEVGKWSFTWTDEDAMLLQPGIDDLRSHKGRFYSEHRVDITEFVGHDSLGRRQYGTLDAAIVNDEYILISDLKWGRGVPVYPKANKQIQIYALGFWHSIGRPDVQKFLLNIDQPRHMGGGGTWETTLPELVAFGEWIRERAEATRAPNPPRTASPSGCMWCRRKMAPGGCDAHDRYLLDVMMIGLDDLDSGVIPMPEVLTPERRAVLLQHRKMIEKYLEQIQEQALEDALAGRPVGPMKAVYGRKDADRWLNEERAAAAVEPVLGASSFNKKLISPHQVGKKVSPDSFDWLMIEPLIKRGERKPVLVPEEDDRPAIVTAEQISGLDDL